jgi:hypothetical protein
MRPLFKGPKKTSDGESAGDALKGLNHVIFVSPLGVYWGGNNYFAVVNAEILVATQRPFVDAAQVL